MKRQTDRIAAPKRRVFPALVAGLSALAALGVLAALPARFAGTPTAKDYPAADVLVLSENTAFVLHPDGRVTEKVHRIEKILTYHGMDETGDPKIAFDKENQSLTFQGVVTYTPEGRKAVAKANSFNEMTPFALAKAPEYTQWRQMVVTKVALDVNAVVETEFTLEDTKPWRRFLEGVVVLRDRDPALVRQVSVTVPEGTKLNAKLFFSAVNPEVQRGGGTTTWTWTFKNLALVKRREMGHGEEAFLPQLVFTTCLDWRHHADQIGGLVAKARAAVSPELDAKVEALLKGVDDPVDRVEKLHEYVAESINTVRWPLAAFDYVPRSASRVYDGGYGHALDKAVLLCAMLDKAGVDSAIAAVTKTVKGGVEPSAVPCLAQLKSVLVRAKVGGEVLWLAPDAPLTRRSKRDFIGSKGLPLLPGMAKLHTLTASGVPDLIRVEVEATADKDLALAGKATLEFSGRSCPYYRLRGSESAQKAFLGSFLASVLPGSSVKAFSVLRMGPERAAFTATFNTPAPKASAGVKVLRTGVPKGSLLAGLSRAPWSRSLPLVLHGSGRESVHLSVVLPPGRKPFILPAKGAATSTPGSFSREWTVEEGRLEARWKLEITDSVIGPADYPSFRKLAGLAAAEAGNTALFH